MDLSALLAQEGIRADDADTLVAWARQRAAALVTRIEPGSPLAQQLGAALDHALEHTRGGGPAPVAVDVPVSMPRQSSRGISRPIHRQVSSPYLGAAVQAALTRNELALEQPPEPAEPEIAEIAAEPPAPEPEPEPAPVTPEDEDASIGGFNRFAFSLRRRVIETSPVEEPPAPVREPEPVEDSSESAVAWQAVDLEVPAPPGFETRPGQDVPTNRARASEQSDSLVVGIPDDDSIDIPLPRPRPHSESRKIAAASMPQPEAQAAVSSASLSSEALELDGLDIDIPDPPVRESPNPNSHRSPPPPPHSGPHRAASGPQPASSQSGPVPARPSSAPQAAAPALVHSAPPQKYPTPQSSARRKPTTGEQKQVAKPVSEPKAAASKKGTKGRKKVVDLSVPVTTPVVAAAPAVARSKASIGNHLPTGEPSSPGHQVPSYLQDDDE